MGSNGGDMPTTNEIAERCKKVFESTMKVDPATINDETTPDTLLEWDSLAHVQMVLALEKEKSKNFAK